MIIKVHIISIFNTDMLLKSGQLYNLSIASNFITICFFVFFNEWWGPNKTKVILYIRISLYRIKECVAVSINICPWSNPVQVDILSSPHPYCTPWCMSSVNSVQQWKESDQMRLRIGHVKCPFWEKLRSDTWKWDIVLI